MIFFDLDGPILDVRDRYFAVYTHCLNELGGNPISKKAYWELKKNKIPEKEILAKSLDNADIDRYLSQRKELIETFPFLHHDRVWTNLFSMCNEHFIKSPVVLVTLRSNSQNLHIQLNRLKIDSWFSHVLSHPNIEKPDERWKIKVKLIQQSKLLENQKPENCVFIGDTETDILTGRFLNMKTIAVSFGIRTRDNLLKYQPDQICDSPDELIEFLMENIHD